jgi:hypothetical protein
MELAVELAFRCLYDTPFFCLLIMLFYLLFFFFIGGTLLQIRCKNTNLCSGEGTRVILTDLNNNNQTDFVLSSRAFKAMAQKDQDQHILKLGIVDVEYKR